LALADWHMVVAGTYHNYIFLAFRNTIYYSQGHKNILCHLGNDVDCRP